MLVDAHGREINYLRLSVTQKCNFRCLYCMPKIPFDHVLQEDLLSFEELFIFVRALIDRGVVKSASQGVSPCCVRI